MRIRKKRQSGIALLLAIFVLLLVCVVGLAMMGASGTETSLSGNYRSSTAVYYAALSGLEEGRGRLLPKNPNYISSLPPFGSTLPLGHVIYITNPLPSGSPPDIVDPTNLGNPATYPDTDWATEFPLYNPPSSVQTVPSAVNLAGSPNPLYKWVRINALTEDAIRVDVNNTGPSSHPYNQNKIVYFDGNNLTRTVAHYQALGVTALAALPDGSRKLLQYVVAPITLQVPIAAALTLVSPGTAANIVTFSQPPTPSYSFRVNGSDQAPGSNGVLSCTTQPPLPAIGVLNLPDYTSVHDNTLMTPQPGHYTGAGGAVPNVSPSPYVNPQTPTIDMTTATGLTNLVQQIQNTADSVVGGPATGSDMPPAMSFSNPMTVMGNGDLTLSGYTGYGLLVVTGKLTYSGDSGWKGIVLVIGQGVVEETGSADGGEFDGAFFVASTVSGGGPGGGGGATDTLGPVSYTVASPGGKGIYYNSCWVTAAQKPITYKILSFHEIPYP